MRFRRERCKWGWLCGLSIMSSADLTVVESQNYAYVNDQPDFAVVTICAEPMYTPMWLENARMNTQTCTFK